MGILVHHDDEDPSLWIDAEISRGFSSIFYGHVASNIFTIFNFCRCKDIMIYFHPHWKHFTSNYCYSNSTADFSLSLVKNGHEKVSAALILTFLACVQKFSFHSIAFYCPALGSRLHRYQIRPRL